MHHVETMAELDEALYPGCAALGKRWQELLQTDKWKLNEDVFWVRATVHPAGAFTAFPCDRLHVSWVPGTAECNVGNASAPCRRSVDLLISIHERRCELPAAAGR